ncbi:MAG: hypothetical protein CFE31_10990 [Rhizobiales bacterium PAR1]|nr:MAG: hypothetical protein CFE31_10990 [Rhizobiales bacterium PAR1]
MTRLAHLIAIVWFGLALAGCGPGGSGDVRGVQTEKHIAPSGETVTILRAHLHSYDSGDFERILQIYKDELIALTPLMPKTRLTCVAGRTCRVYLLPPGAFWPDTYDIEPNNYFASGQKIKDLVDLGRGYSVPLEMDTVREDHWGLRRAPHDVMEEARLIGSLIERESGDLGRLAAFTFVGAILAFILCWLICCGLRWLMPKGMLAAWLDRWPSYLLVAFGCYALAILVSTGPFIEALVSGPMVRGVDGTGMFGARVTYLTGETPLAPLLKMLTALASGALFHWTARLFIPAKSPKDTPDAAV